MKILFDKERQGELRDILGISDADITSENLWPYLRTFSREIRNIIGKENYALCEAEFTEQNDEDVAELVDLVRYAVALATLRKYAQLNDVDYTTSGRLFRRDDHVGAATDNMVSRSDDALERAYYAAIDEIISYILDEENELEPSDYMLQFAGLFVPSLEEFQKYVHINDSHLLYFKLAPSLRMCEQREIINRMGNKMAEYRGKKDDFITALVQQCCVYFAMADGVQKLSVQLFPEGLMKAERFGRKSASGYDKESLSLYYRNQLESLLKMLEVELKKLNTVYVPPRTINFGENDGFVTTS